jgi:hypothetical protein
MLFHIRSHVWEYPLTPHVFVAYAGSSAKNALLLWFGHSLPYVPSIN